MTADEQRAWIEAARARCERAMAPRLVGEIYDRRGADALAGRMARMDLPLALDLLEAAEQENERLRAELKIYHDAARTWTAGQPFGTTEEESP